MFEIYGRTSTGIVREHNEDGFQINQMVVCDGSLHPKGLTMPFMAAVADGMGGSQAGEVACAIALESCAALALPADEGALRALVDDIQDKLWRRSEQNPDCHGLGTTLTGMAVDHDQILAIHIGDSRLYRFRGGYLKQLTKDHTLAQALYEYHAIENKDLASHPEKHVLLRCLSGGQRKSAEAEVFQVRGMFQPGDRFLLCTDGLSNELTHDELESIMSEAGDSAVIVDRMFEAAYSRGAADNLTALLITRK